MPRLARDYAGAAKRIETARHGREKTWQSDSETLGPHQPRVAKIVAGQIRRHAVKQFLTPSLAVSGLFHQNPISGYARIEFRQFRVCGGERVPVLFLVNPRVGKILVE